MTILRIELSGASIWSGDRMYKVVRSKGFQRQGSGRRLAFTLMPYFYTVVVARKD